MGEFFAGLVGAIAGAGIFCAGIAVGVKMIKQWEGWG
jgi:hypothetical protein